MINKLLEKRLLSKFFAWGALATYSGTVVILLFSSIQSMQLSGTFKSIDFWLLTVTVLSVLADSKILNGLFSQTKVVQTPPGSILLSVAEFALSKRCYSTVLLPSVSDMREEYFEALSQNRIWKARWVRVRGTYSFFAAIGLDRALAFVSFFVKAWKSVN